jgi:hypothetical protein
LAALRYTLMDSFFRRPHGARCFSPADFRSNPNQKPRTGNGAGLFFALPHLTEPAPKDPTMTALLERLRRWFAPRPALLPVPVRRRLPRTFR